MNDGISFEEYLNKNGSLTYSNVGTSMLPMLRQGRDIFTVRKKGEERCKRGDVVLYRRPPDQYVLHRIIKVRPEDYVILGDNCIAKEYGIRDESIIGVLTGFVRDGKEYSVTDPGYRVYSALWLNTMPIRIAVKKCILKAKRLVRGKRS